jgi:hypothetical protein
MELKDVPGQEIRDETVSELIFFMKDASHLLLFDHEHSRRRNRGRHPDPKRHAGQTPLTEEGAGPQKRHDRFFALLTDDRTFTAPFGRYVTVEAISR